MDACRWIGSCQANRPSFTKLLHPFVGKSSSKGGNRKTRKKTTTATNAYYKGLKKKKRMESTTPNKVEKKTERLETKWSAWPVQEYADCGLSHTRKRFKRTKVTSCNILFVFG